MLQEKDLKGIYVPIITPFDEAFGLDAGSFYNHALALFQNEIHGLVVSGTTGESPTLTSEEVRKLVATAQSARGAAQSAAPIVVGTGTNDTSASVRKTEQAGNLGADAALVVVPYYSRPSQQGIIEHFKRIAEVGVPVILYEIPQRTGVKLELDTVRAILELDGVIGMKDSTSDTSLVMELSRLGSKPVLCGDDALLYRALEAGAAGGMTASANVMTKRFGEVFRQFSGGDLVQGRKTFEELLPLIRLLFQEPNPAPLKWLLAQSGVIASGALRLPNVPITEGLQARLREFRV
ncbi:4-hydroxy-tetrahydrodipicolinate synthase [Paenibacillus ferrarius]|uniref:4-hydroxy-tetrahydrodipicolinate synthase n=1 Tax=Paenibacillus ferrarius TaxID=1469647 RepID=UPI003D2D2E41